MNGIYLTEKGKQEIEAKLEALQNEIIWLDNLEKNRRDKGWDESYLENLTEQTIYKEILSSATILPSVESWSNTMLYRTPNQLEMLFPKGVIIQPKK
jgi:hypothetical protein